MQSLRFPKSLRLSISLSLIACTLIATSGCSTTASVRVSQIPVRAELRQCVALAPTPPESRPAIASDPDLSAFAPVLGLAPESPAMVALQEAAGNYARRAQYIERAAGDRRDLSQAAITREMCEKLGEALTLIDANNQGPQN